MRAFQIDAVAQTVAEVEYSTLADLQALVGGSIEIAKTWPDGTTLFVDENGLAKPAGPEFWVVGNPWPLGSLGVVVGPELPEEFWGDEDTLSTAPPGMTIDALRAEITFKSREQAAAWAKANASEPAAIVNDEVVARVGDIYGSRY
jgi:hypothetical protein